jgi:hypothetical protein
MSAALRFLRCLEILPSFEAQLLPEVSLKPSVIDNLYMF